MSAIQSFSVLSIKFGVNMPFVCKALYEAQEALQTVSKGISMVRSLVCLERLVRRVIHAFSIQLS